MTGHRLQTPEQRQLDRLARAEMALWFLVAVGTLAIYMFRMMSRVRLGYEDLDAISFVYPALSVFGVVVLIAMFRASLGASPILWIRLRSSGRTAAQITELMEALEPPVDREETALSKLAMDANAKPAQFLALTIDRSTKQARRIDTSSRGYLMAGAFIAGVGLFIFYFNSPNLDGKPWDTAILLLLPRFGMLFFIEFVAFFFLRLHRAAMDDYRAFEGHVRHREELLTLFAIAVRGKTQS